MNDDDDDDDDDGICDGDGRFKLGLDGTVS